MHISTSTHVLNLAEDHIYNLRKVGVAGDDSWLEARCGEAFDRRLQVKLKNQQLDVYFEDKYIGNVPLSNYSQCLNLVDFVKNWNLQVGPNDYTTVRTCELVRDWSSLYTSHSLTIKCVTWNCAGFLADSALKRDTWIKLLGDKTVTSKQDIIVIGFQETDNLNRSVKSNSQTLQTCADISRDYLYRDHTLVSTVQLLGLMSLIFVRTTLVPHISNLHTDTISTGFLRVWGNKGAVLTRFNLFRDDIIGGGFEISIINCHLSAGEGIAQLGRRRWELGEIGSKFNVKGLTGSNQSILEEDQRNPDETDSISSISSEEENPSSIRGLNPDEHEIPDDHSLYDEDVFSTHNGLLAPPPAKQRTGSNMSSDCGTLLLDDNDRDLLEHPEPAIGSLGLSPPVALSLGFTEGVLNTRSSKYIVVLGDLNYRVLLPQGEVEKKVKESQWSGLLAHDSLTLERHNDSVLRGFEEPAIHFAPTYKYNIDSSKLAGRVPSYTDRIMFRTNCQTQVLNYTSIPDLKSSDHKPVIYEATVEASNCIDSAKRANTLARAMKIIDEAENNARPKLEVDQQQLTLEGPPLSMQFHEFEVTNLGSRPFKFVIENAYTQTKLALDVNDESKVSATQKTRTQGGLEPTTSNSARSSTTSIANSSNFFSTSSTTLATPAHGATSPSAGLNAIYSDHNLVEKGLYSGHLISTRKQLDTKPLTEDGDITVTPDNGSVTFTRPTAKIKLGALVGIEPRDFIALVRTQNAAEGAGQKYIVVKIVPSKSYLGVPLSKLPIELGPQIPAPIYKCIEYLRSNASSPEPVPSSVFLHAAEPSLFQQILGWLDRDEPLDLEVLNIANNKSIHAGSYAVAQVLLTIFRYMGTKWIGPNIKRRTVTMEKVITYICRFLNEIQADELTLDLWASLLYDSSDNRAGKVEKRSYLRSMMINAETKGV